ncbi:MAG: FeoA family protein [Chitinispirillia bacterium]|jgi:Fe2+ transport system protein FeoA
MNKLTAHNEGDSVIIRKINGRGDFKKRLLEMGFTKDAEIKIVKYAPLKDPIEIKIKGFFLSLRIVEADQILVDNITKS